MDYITARAHALFHDRDPRQISRLWISPLPYNKGRISHLVIGVDQSTHQALSHRAASTDHFASSLQWTLDWTHDILFYDHGCVHTIPVLAGGISRG